MEAERKIAAAGSAGADNLPSLAPPLSSDHDPQLGALFGGQYRIEQKLGSGGMGAVYRATQLSVDRAVAIKVIAPAVEQSAEHVERFRREAEALAKLRHPNTVHLLDSGVTEDGRLFIVMELLSGVGLETQLAAHRPLQLSAALRILRQIARSLSEAHAVGVIHRDLKPSNVFLCHVDGGDSFVKVMDFGVAGFMREQVDRSALTLKGTVLGTAAYMAPEQAQGNAVDARADLYSLGVVLFEMLTGRPPFEASSAVSLLLAHVSQDPPRLASVCPGMPELEEVQALLDVLLDKEIEQRLPSANALIERIDALLARLGEMPMLPVGQSLTPSMQLPAQRRHTRLPSTRVLVALSAAIALISLFAWQRSLPATSLGDVALAPLAFLQGPWGKPAPTRVTIASVPSGATVKLAGAELGKTPYELALKSRTEIELDLDGHATQTLLVDPGGDPNLVVKLVPLPPLR